MTKLKLKNIFANIPDGRTEASTMGLFPILLGKGGRCVKGRLSAPSAAPDEVGENYSTGSRSTLHFVKS